MRAVARRKVRAFGEMIALLWARGDRAATLWLEQLWHELCQTQEFSLFLRIPEGPALLGMSRNPSPKFALLIREFFRPKAPSSSVGKRADSPFSVGTEQF